MSDCRWLHKPTAMARIPHPAAQLTDDQRVLQDKLRSVREYVGSVLTRT
jgi:hypothetical protein